MSLIERFSKSVISFGLFKTIFFAIPEYFLVIIFSNLRRREIKRNKEIAVNNVILKDIHGSKMYLDLDDMGLPQDLAVDGTREHYATQQVISFLKPGDIVVDIGANIGYYTLLEAKIVGDSGFVYAIEPVPNTFKMLTRNIEANNYKNILALNLAVGDKNSQVEMYICHNRCNLSSMKPLPEMTTSKITVEQITIDDFLVDKPLPRLIRMDVEGYEYQVIKGMKNTFERSGSLYVFIELHFHLLKREESLEILHTFKDNGFKVTAATIEKQGQMKHKRLLSLASFFHRRLLNMPISHGVLDITLDEIITNDEILSGKWDALELFFYHE
jgi:FkbM family methyltransferase